MNKSELKKLLKEDKILYKNDGLLKRIFLTITRNPKKYILKYIILSRKYNYYKKHRKTIINKILFLIYSFRKNKLGMKINLEVNSEFGENLQIYHRNIVINPYARIGNNCALHGNNCIGNKGNSNNECPKIGNNVDIGFGAVIIGNVHIADNIIIGANAVVTKSFDEEGIVIAGNPAKKIKEK